MYSRGCSHLLSFVGVIALFQPVCLAFNLDTADPIIFYGDENGFFGNKVMQVTTGKHKGILVTAPLQNGSGKVCIHYMNDDSNTCYTPEADMPARLFGLSVAKEPTKSRFTVCSPSLAHDCYENSYLNSQCYQLNEELLSISSFKPAFQECTKKTVDLVFLFDGSASMTIEEFDKNKEFILDIMNSIKNSSIKFAAVQFSLTARKVFDFNEYQNGMATELLRMEPFMQSLTSTYYALNFTLYNLFENKAAGASPDATKVLVIITDGDPSDGDRFQAIKNYDAKRIIRFVIGVKNVDLKNLKAIASEPKENNTYPIENYDGLAGILKNFEEKIFNIEDYQTGASEELKYEMSQTGFSGVYHKGSLVLGSVGSHNWGGSLYVPDPLEKSHGTHIADPDMQPSSYMGYSVAAGEKDSVSLYFTGAPRFEHTGEVVLFKKTTDTWTVVQRVVGEQIGSYFGAELCLVDVQSDGNTDFLLVGAPLFHNPQEKREGQIYVYKLTNKLELEIALNVSVPLRGRFGTAISSLADLNGDGFRDVAVGAPLEEDNRGAVYIYLGNQNTGIQPTFSQRIPAVLGNAGIRFFGQALDGNIDLGEDGLPDLVVGSHGAVIILRSKPVVNVKAHMDFDSAEISTANINCPGNQQAPLPMVVLRVCFDLAEVTRRTGTSNIGLNISYSLNVDSLRQTSRGFFEETDTRNLQRTEELTTNNKRCFTHPVNMPNCVSETLSPITFRLKYAQHESEKAANILNEDSATQATTEVPFEKNCRTNDTCIAELEVDFNFNTPTLVVVNNNNFNVTIRLHSNGDDSFNTKLYLFYPAGLSFSMLNLLKATRPTLPSCKDLGGILDQTICGISLPVYRSGTNATFQALFRIMDTFDWPQNISMTIAGKSDNNNSTKSSITKSIPVQYQVESTVTVHEDTISYLNFTLGDHAPKKVDVIYEVENRGWKALPVFVSVTVPTNMTLYDFEMRNYQVVVEQGKPCVEITMETPSEHCSPDMNCKTMACEPFSLAKYSTTKVVLSGEVSFKGLEHLVEGRSMFEVFTGRTQDFIWKSFVEVTYDKDRYVQASSKQANDMRFPRAQPFIRFELILPPDIMLIASVGVGSGLLLLLIIALVMCKMGFFRRKTAEYFKEQDELEQQEEMEEQRPGSPHEGDALESPEKKGPPPSPDGSEPGVKGGSQGSSEDSGEDEITKQPLLENVEVPFTN